MNTREIATEYRLSHWAQVMQDRNVSGMSIKDYCKSSGFGTNTYFYWQRKLREAACQELLSKPQSMITDLKNAVVPSGWALCEDINTTDKAKPLTIEINGCRILVGCDDDLEMLSKVCRVLRGL